MSSLFAESPTSLARRPQQKPKASSSPLPSLRFPMRRDRAGGRLSLRTLTSALLARAVGLCSLCQFLLCGRARRPGAGTLRPFLLLRLPRRAGFSLDNSSRPVLGSAASGLFFLEPPFRALCAFSFSFSAFLQRRCCCCCCPRKLLNVRVLLQRLTIPSTAFAALGSPRVPQATAGLLRHPWTGY